MRALVLLLILAACGRPLTEGEEAFAKAFHGDGLDTSKVRIGPNPLIKLYVSTVPIPPRTTCGDKLFPPATTTHFTGPPAATVLFNKINVNPDASYSNYMPKWPQAQNLRAAACGDPQGFAGAHRI